MFVVVSLVAGVLGAVAGAPPALAAAGGITTVAAPLPGAFGLDETAGELLVSQSGPNLVRKVDVNGGITTFAGGGTDPLGDGGPATEAAAMPERVAVDAVGNLFVVENQAQRVRRVTTGADSVVDGDADEVITRVAGNGTRGFSGDGGPASAAMLAFPDHIVIDAAANLFLFDSQNRRIRRVTPGADGVVDGDADEIITTVAGNGTTTAAADGGPATAGSVGGDGGLVFDTAGNLYVATSTPGGRVRRVVPGADGIIDGGADELVSTVAGGGTLLPGPGNPGEGAAATSVTLDRVYSMVRDVAGNLFLGSTNLSNRDHVLRVTPAGVLTTVAGTGPRGNGGDGGPAVAGQLNWPYGMTFDASGNLYVSQLVGLRVRKVVPGADGVISGAPDETITRFAGIGTQGFTRDGALATDAMFGANSPNGLAAASGNVYIVDRSNRRVRMVDPAGVLTTVVGGGVGDGLPATSATLKDPRGLIADGTGKVFIADCGNDRVRMVDSSGVISTLLRAVPCPSGLYLVGSGPQAGTLYVAVADGHKVIKRDPAGAVSTVAGTGAAGFSGDGGLAVAAQLSSPTGVHLDATGNLYIADNANNRVRKVTPAGTISTVAGDGSTAYGLDAVAATTSSVVGPSDMVLDPSGGLVIAETRFHRIRRVSPAGIITTLAGNGIPSYLGDGGPATAALLASPTQLDFDSGGALLFTDRGNGAVRRIEAGTPPPAPTSGCGRVVTKTLKLKADLGPCEGDGLVVAADNIVIDLDGHTISGTDGPTDNVGIRLTGRRGVQIKGRATKTRAKGTVRGFDAGVALIGGSGNTVRDLNIRDNLGSPDTATYGDGIGVFFSSDNRIRDSIIDNNGPYDGIGILGAGSHRNLIDHNEIANTDSLGGFAGAGTGIFITPFLSDLLERGLSVFGNQVIANTVRDNDNSGISSISNVDGAIVDNKVETNGRDENASPRNGIGVQANQRALLDTNVLVQRNTVIGNGGQGVNIASSSNHVLNNEVHANLAGGIVLFGGDRAQRNEIRQNNAADNPNGDGDLADFFFNEATSAFDCDHNTWFGNTWGSGGFWPDPALLGTFGPVACTTFGGTAAPTTAASTTAAAAASAATTAAAPGGYRAPPPVPTDQPRWKDR